MTTTQVILGAVGWLALTFGAAWLGSRFLRAASSLTAAVAAP